MRSRATAFIGGIGCNSLNDYGATITRRGELNGRNERINGQFSRQDPEKRAHCFLVLIFGDNTIIERNARKLCGLNLISRVEGAS